MNATTAIYESIRADFERLVEANLRDADLAAKSPEFRDGYTQGIREATYAYVEALCRNYFGGPKFGGPAS